MIQPHKHIEGATSYDCLYIDRQGEQCDGTTHLQDDLFVCDTCSYSWDTYGFPKGKHHV